MPDEKSADTTETPEVPETDIVTEEPDYSQMENTDGTEVLTEEAESGELQDSPDADVSSEAAPPSAASVPAPTEAEWQNEHFGLGRVLGLTEEEVRQFGSPERFEEVMGNASRAFGQIKQESPGDPKAGLAHLPVTAADGEEGEEDTEESIQEFELSDPELYDDEIVKMADHFNQQVLSLQAELQKTREQASRHELAEQQRQSEAAAREFDVVCDRMDEETFGRGRLNDLDHEQAMRRVDLANEVSRLGHGYIARGEDVPPLEQLADKAAGSLFGDRLQKRGLQAVSERTRRVASQATAVPTQQESRPLTGKEAAIQAASNWQQENWGHVVNDPNEFPE